MRHLNKIFVTFDIDDDDVSGLVYFISAVLVYFLHVSQHCHQGHRTVLTTLFRLTLALLTKLPITFSKLSFFCLVGSFWDVFMFASIDARDVFIRFRLPSNVAQSDTEEYSERETHNTHTLAAEYNSLCKFQISRFSLLWLNNTLVVVIAFDHNTRNYDIKHFV